MARSKRWSIYPCVLLPNRASNGKHAVVAAGTIHTDFAKGFIRAEVIAFDDYISSNGESGAKEKGLLRLEGKDYVMNDGDVVHFRFNV